MRFIAPALERDAVRAALDDNVEICAWADAEGPAGALSAALRDLSGPVGFEAQHLTIANLRLLQLARPELAFVEADGILVALRARKSNDEIKQIRRAAACADAAISRTLDEAVRVGRTELEIARDCASFLLDAGAETFFDPVVLAGVRSALPHGKPTSNVLGAGDLVLIDIGVACRGYFADVTRTVVIGADATEQQQILFDTVCDSRAAAVASARPGAPCSAVDRAARCVIEAAGFGAFFVHRTGHGLGLDVHEAPSISAANEDLLEPGMVVTIEPGIYIPGYGGVRIEDDIIVADPPEVVTHVRATLNAG